MIDVKFSNMSTPELITFYNRHSTNPVNRFSDRKTAERRCSELWAKLQSYDMMKQKIDNPENTRPAMQTSLKLDRTIRCVETGDTWKNAYRMWCDNPDWMTSAQQDRLTAQLYAAAKAGEKKRITINERTFELVNVQRVKK